MSYFTWKTSAVRPNGWLWHRLMIAKKLRPRLAKAGLDDEQGWDHQTEESNAWMISSGTVWYDWILAFTQGQICTWLFCLDLVATEWMIEEFMLLDSQISQRLSKVRSLPQYYAIFMPYKLCNSGACYSHIQVFNNIECFRSIAFDFECLPAPTYDLYTYIENKML